MVLEPRFLIPDSIYSPLYHLASFAFIQEQKKKNFFFLFNYIPNSSIQQAHLEAQPRILGRG